MYIWVPVLGIYIHMSRHGLRSIASKDLVYMCSQTTYSRSQGISLASYICTQSLVLQGARG